MGRVQGLLTTGAIGPPLFLAVIAVNDRVKPDYDPVRDFVSEAAIGRGGWVQIVNFVVCGALIVAGAVGVRQVVSRWTGYLVGVVGGALVLAGVFVSDSQPSDVSTWHSIAHNAVSVAVFAVLTVACFVAARWRPTPVWRWYCYATGVLVPVLFVLSGGSQSITGLLQRLTIVVGWTWLTVLFLRSRQLHAWA